MPQSQSPKSRLSLGLKEEHWAEFTRGKLQLLVLGDGKVAVKHSVTGAMGTGRSIRQAYEALK